MDNRSSLEEACTPRQRFWLEHLEACRERGSSLKAYALAHDLSPGALYAAKSDLKRRGLLPASTLPVPVPAPKLLPVHIARAAVMFRVVLPNGVVVEVPEHADAQCCRELLGCASALS
jgi:hypothetical protein